MKFEKIKTLKILEFTYFYSLMLMVRLKDILHIDTPEPSGFDADFSGLKSALSDLKSALSNFKSVELGFKTSLSGLK